MSRIESGSDRGFTLIEVLVAVALTSTAIAALLPTFGRGAEMTDRTRASLRAVAAAHNVLESIGSTSPLVRGELAGNDDGSSWQMTIRERRDGSRRSTLFDIDLRVVSGRSSLDVTTTALVPPARRLDDRP